MNKYKKFTDGQLSEHESEAFVRQKMTKAFDEEQKKEWSARLAAQHGIRRSPPRRKLRGIIYIGALAASLALFLLAYPMLFSPSAGLEQQLTLALADPFPNYLTRKGAVEETETIRLQMAEAYNARNYEQAISLGRQLGEKPDRSTEDLFFLGLSYLYQGSLAEAVQTLVYARESSVTDGRFLEEIDWYLSLAYLKNKNRDRAKDLLEKIVANGQWNSESAKKMLKRID